MVAWEEFRSSDAAAFGRQPQVRLDSAVAILSLLELHAQTFVSGLKTDRLLSKEKLMNCEHKSTANDAVRLVRYCVVFHGRYLARCSTTAVFSRRRH